MIPFSWEILIRMIVTFRQDFKYLSYYVKITAVLEEASMNRQNMPLRHMFVFSASDGRIHTIPDILL